MVGDLAKGEFIRIKFDMGGEKLCVIGAKYFSRFMEGGEEYIVGEVASLNPVGRPFYRLVAVKACNVFGKVET